MRPRKTVCPTSVIPNRKKQRNMAERTSATCAPRFIVGTGSALLGRALRCRLQFGPTPGRNVVRRGVAFHDRDVLDLHRVEGPVVAVPRHGGDLLYSVAGSHC